MRVHRWIGWALILLVFLGGFAGHSWCLLSRPLDPEGQMRVVEVKRGENLRDVRQRLLAQRILLPRAPLIFWARLTGQDRRIKSGFYELTPAQSPREIMEILVEGRTLRIQVTIPEGLTCSRILSRLAEALGEPKECFQAAASDSAWIRSLGLPVPDLEGYLYPETYTFERGMLPRDLLAAMVSACLEQFTEGQRRRADSLGLSLHEVLTLASIIEAETAIGEERARISAVYWNRLRLGRLLQADPTVAYALGRFGQRLWEQHLKVDSPYNTYLYPGLPPGPICSPGLESIDAALKPLADCHDLYFVARGDGTHIFSRSLKAHNRAKQSVRRGQ